MRNVILEQLEVVGSETCVCNLSYLEQGRQAVLDKTIERATRLNKDKAPKFFIVRSKREAGYLNNSYPSDNVVFEELSRREISEKEALSLVKK